MTPLSPINSWVILQIDMIDSYTTISLSLKTCILNITRSDPRRFPIPKERKINNPSYCYQDEVTIPGRPQWCTAPPQGTSQSSINYIPRWNVKSDRKCSPRRSVLGGLMIEGHVSQRTAIRLQDLNKNRRIIPCFMHAAEFGISEEGGRRGLGSWKPELDILTLCGLRRKSSADSDSLFLRKLLIRAMQCKFIRLRLNMRHFFL